MQFIFYFIFFFFAHLVNIKLSTSSFVLVLFLFPSKQKWNLIMGFAVGGLVRQIESNRARWIGLLLFNVFASVKISQMEMVKHWNACNTPSTPHIQNCIATIRNWMTTKAKIKSRQQNSWDSRQYNLKVEKIHQKINDNNLSFYFKLFFSLVFYVHIRLLLFCLPLYCSVCSLPFDQTISSFRLFLFFLLKSKWSKRVWVEKRDGMKKENEKHWWWRRRNTCTWRNALLHSSPLQRFCPLNCSYLFFFLFAQNFRFIFFLLFAKNKKQKLFLVLFIAVAEFFFFVLFA